jgi:SAM-dependent methyltransferase/uncharacterized protein YbaR (Trm112 family)
MRPWLLPLLGCPACAREAPPLALEAAEQRDDEIVAGRLCCAAGHAYPLVDGIPDFVGGQPASDSAFYDTLWDAHARQRYTGRIAEYTEKFQAYARLPEPLSRHFTGKVVLDAGCGEGRFTFLARELGASGVVALDYSREALARARAATDGASACAFVRADLLHPPLRRVFDYAFSLGVLHHTPDSELGFRALVSCLKPGGQITVFVYAPGSLPRVIWPLRRLTLGMESARLARLCDTFGFGYDPARRSLVSPGRLFRRLGRLDFLGIGRVTFEGLRTPYLREHSLPEVLRWFGDTGVELVSSTPAVSASGRLPGPS